MKVIKRMISMAMAGLLVLSMAACHPKDETAVTINDVKISSALYMAALMQAEGEAKNKVSEDQKSSGSTSSIADADYYTKSIDGKKFVDYVKDRALEICSEFAAYDILKKQEKFTISADKLSEADYYAKYYWDQGYSQAYSLNGISLETYQKQVKYSYMADAYFLSLYGAGGPKAISKSVIAATMKTKYEIVRRIDVQFTSEMTDAQKTALKTQLTGYEKRLQAGTSFETIYNEYNKKTDTSTSSVGSTSSENQIDMSESSGVSSSTTTSSTSSTATSSAVSSAAGTSSSTTSSGTAAPEAKDKLASVIGASDTDSADPNFEAIKKMKVGEAKLFTLANEGGLSLVVRGDITLDPYYLTSLNDSILRLLKTDEFKADMNKYVKTLTVKENKYATGRFSVKGIKYPTNNAAAQ